MIKPISLGNGFAPDVTIIGQVTYAAVPLEANLKLLKFLPDGTLIGETILDGFLDSFPRFGGNWLAYKSINGFGVRAINLVDGRTWSSPSSADGNWGFCFGAPDQLFWQSSSRYEIMSVNLVDGTMTPTPMTGAPDGLDHLSSSGIVLRKDMVGSDPATGGFPAYSPNLGVGQYGYGLGVRANGQRWIPGDASNPHPDPRCADDGQTGAVICGGPAGIGVRLYLAPLAEFGTLPLTSTIETPAPAPAPVPVPLPGPAPMPTTPTPFDFATLDIVGGSTDIRGWAETTRITALDVSLGGVSVDFNLKTLWPETLDPANGDTVYTLWHGQFVDGRWHAAGILQFYRGLEKAGGAIYLDNQIAGNWTYFAPPINRQPLPGELVAFFVTQGNERRKDNHTLAERSNAVVVPFPSGPQRFEFNGAPLPIPVPSPTPTPVPTPAPIPVPAPTPIDPPVDIQPLLDRIAALEGRVRSLENPVIVPRHVLIDIPVVTRGFSLRAKGDVVV